MTTFLLEALTATVISIVVNTLGVNDKKLLLFIVKLISRKYFTNDNHTNYHPQTTQDEIVIVADSHSHANKLFKFSNYI